MVSLIQGPPVLPCRGTASGARGSGLRAGWYRAASTDRAKGTARAAVALADLEDLFFLVLGGQVDLLHVGVGELLNLVVRLLLVVFGDLLVLQ